MTPGQINFEAYKLNANDLSFDGITPIPVWDNLSEQVKANWEAGALAVLQSAKKGNRLIEQNKESNRLRKEREKITKERVKLEKVKKKK